MIWFCLGKLNLLFFPLVRVIKIPELKCIELGHHFPKSMAYEPAFWLINKVRLWGQKDTVLIVGGSAT